MVDGVLRNIALAETLIAERVGPALIAAVCGDPRATAFWERRLAAASTELGARQTRALHEDLPVNQALGILLCWERLRDYAMPGSGTLATFIFGEGVRAAPLTQAEGGQKPAIATFVRRSAPDGSTAYWSVAELAMRYFVPVETFLRRSGFDGMLVKWGDEIQVPSVDLSGVDRRFAQADIVRFVSMQTMNETNAKNKDWLGVDEVGSVCGFIPRRPLSDMRRLVEQGLLQARGDDVVGGVNLGSIAMSRPLLDALLAAFRDDVFDVTAQRSARPDLDPVFFSAVICAADPQPEAAWQALQKSVPAVAQATRGMPGLFERVREVITAFCAARGRKLSVQALDLGTPFWGDVGQHQAIYDFYMALNAPDGVGHVARAMAGIDVERDANNNIIVGDTSVGPDADVRDSVLIDSQVARGHVRGSVLVGTCAESLHATEAFAVLSQIGSMTLPSRSGAYRAGAGAPAALQPGYRVAGVRLKGECVHLLVHENADLKNRAETFERPLEQNPISFAEAQRRLRLDLG